MPPRYVLPVSPSPVDLAEFRLLRALRSGGAGAPFIQLWNAQAGAMWSVFRAMVERDDEAIGWMASFRLALQERVNELRVDEPVGPQVGRALYAHAVKELGAAGAMPAGPLTPDEAGLRQLPPGTRLAYLIDLFFDWAPPEPTVHAAHRLLEPDDDTDSRLLVYTALLRNPPGEAKILPPGEAPEPSAPRRASSLPFVIGVAMALGLGAWAYATLQPVAETPDWPVGFVLSDADPARMGPRLRDSGVPSWLAVTPDLEEAGLTLRAATVDRDGVVLRYDGDGADWSLHHTSRRGEAPDPALRLESDSGVSRVSWITEGGRWTLAANAPPERVLAAARVSLARTAPSALPSAAP